MIDTKIVAEIFNTEEDEAIRISRETDGARVRVLLRRWYRDGTGEWRPSSAGIEFKAKHAAPVVGAILNAATARGSK